MQTAHSMPAPAARPFMRLVGDDATEVKTSIRAFPRLRLATAERRMFARSEVSARVQGRRLDHTIDARREPCLNLLIQDLSTGGLSAVSQTVLCPGEQVAIFFPPQAGRRGWDAVGTVVRCEPVGFGYRVGVEFEQAPSAA